MTSSMADPPCGPLVGAVDASESDAGEVGSAARLRALVEENYDFVWRTLRHLGLDDATAKDGAQQVMCVLARRVDRVTPGAERRFLFATSVRVASTLRRSQKRRAAASLDEIAELVASTPSGEELLDERRARETLQRVLEALPIDLRAVFILYEIEELSSPEIAATLGVPVGTISSRLRRARETFAAITRRMQAASRRRGT